MFQAGKWFFKNNTPVLQIKNFHYWSSWHNLPQIGSLSRNIKYNWGEDNELIRKRIKYLIFSIRKKLAEITADIEVIQTAGRLGYKIISD
jgi:DNA-binding response OmpR family regulator